jgi:diketogulonate reductase-like aldo/keto reductase
MPTRERQREFGAGGRPVAVIGQGTWALERDDRTEAIAALRRGLDLGLTHVDTAEMYGDGRVETLVGEAIRGRRDPVFLVSKVLPQHATPAGIRRACESSLRRLGTDRLDCYLLHWPSRHPLEGTIETFAALVAEGRIASWGVSNFDVDLLDEALRIAGPGRIACNQVLYHLEERAIEHAVAPWCARHGVALVGYSPFGSGAFPSPRSAGGKVLGAIATARGATPRQVALAFLTRDPGTFAIPKAARAAHVDDNAGAAGLVLSAEEVRRLDAAFPARRRRALPTS